MYLTPARCASSKETQSVDYKAFRLYKDKEVQLKSILPTWLDCLRAFISQSKSLRRTQFFPVTLKLFYKVLNSAQILNLIKNIRIPKINSPSLQTSFECASYTNVWLSYKSFQRWLVSLNRYQTLISNFLPLRYIYSFSKFVFI